MSINEGIMNDTSIVNGEMKVSLMAIFDSSFILCGIQSCSVII